MSKHTPGPWEYSGQFGVNSEGREYGEYLSVDNGSINILGGCGCCSSPWISNEANARLIAAAPELLEALKRCLEIMENGGTWSLEDQNAAHAAIANAEGRESC